MTTNEYEMKLKTIAEDYGLDYEDVKMTCDIIFGGALNRTELFFKMIIKYGEGYNYKSQCDKMLTEKYSK